MLVDLNICTWAGEMLHSICTLADEMIHPVYVPWLMKCFTLGIHMYLG
jgi:hypothetical protein